MGGSSEVWGEVVWGECVVSVGVLSVAMLSVRHWPFAARRPHEGVSMLAELANLHSIGGGSTTPISCSTQCARRGRGRHNVVS